MANVSRAVSRSTPKSARQQLRGKVGSISKSDLAAMEERATRAIEKLSKQYDGWVNKQLKELESLARKKGNMPQDRIIEPVYTIAHDMKGQGGTFGFDTITVLAGMLCEDLRRLTSPPPALLSKTILAYCEAIRSVLENDLKRRDNEVYRSILDVLESWRSKYPNDPPSDT